MSSALHNAVSAYDTRTGRARQLVAWSDTPSISVTLMMGEVERRERFGYALQRAITARGMSERKLAQALGVDARKIAQWRTGKTLPDLYQTQALAAELRVTEELFRNPPPVPPEPAYPIEEYLVESVDAAVDASLAAQPGGDPASSRSSPRKSGRRGR